MNELLPKVQEATNLWLKELGKQGLKVKILSTYRAKEEQDKLYAQGRTEKGNIVTYAKGGQSFHNYRVALDFAPLNDKGVINWDDIELFKKCGEIARQLGFTTLWEINDYGHIQWTAGYTITDFQNGNTDMRKFGVEEIKEESKIPKVLQSSQNPDKISLTLKMVIPLIVSGLASYGIIVPAEIVDTIYVQLPLIISSIGVVYAVIRKFI